MGEVTKIEWAHHTFNPWRGCAKVSAGCANCYAERDSKRNPGVLGVWGPQGTRVVASEAMWEQPRKWDREAQEAGERRRVVCASLADVFEQWQGDMVDSAGLPYLDARDWWYPLAKDLGRLRMDHVRERLWWVIEATPNLDWLLLTKRPEHALRVWPQGGYPEAGTPGTLGRYFTPPNVWIGTSVEDQATADERIPHLLRIPAAQRFLSMEPLLGPVDLTGALNTCRCGRCDYCQEIPDHPTRRVDWVIVGGESGPNARPMHPHWARGLRDQCVAAGVPYFFKQWGEWLPGDHYDLDRGPWEVDTGVVDDPTWGPMMAYRIGKRAAGRLLDGRTWDEVPG